MMAARTGNPESLRLLIDRGANVNAAESLRGTTPLMWAAAYEQGSCYSSTVPIPSSTPTMAPRR